MCRRTRQGCVSRQGIWERTRQNPTQRRSPRLIGETQLSTQRGLFKCFHPLHGTQLRTLTARPWPPLKAGFPLRLPPQLGPSCMASRSTQRALGLPPPHSLSLPGCPAHGTRSLAGGLRNLLSLPCTCFVLRHPLFTATACVHCPCSHQSEFCEGRTLAFCSQLYEQHQKRCLAHRRCSRTTC